MNQWSICLFPVSFSLSYIHHSTNFNLCLTWPIPAIGKFWSSCLVWPIPAIVSYWWTSIFMFDLTHPSYCIFLASFIICAWLAHYLSYWETPVFMPQMAHSLNPIFLANFYPTISWCSCRQVSSMSHHLTWRDHPKTSQWSIWPVPHTASRCSTWHILSTSSCCLTLLISSVMPFWWTLILMFSSMNSYYVILLGSLVNFSNGISIVNFGKFCLH